MGMKSSNGNYKVKKQFLSNNYDIMNESGQKIGTAEKGFFSNNYTVKDKTGKSVTNLNGVPVPVGSLSTGGFIALLVLGIFVFISIDSIPSTLKSAFTEIDVAFWFVTVPFFLHIIVVIAAYLRNKFLPVAHSYWLILFTVVSLGVITYILSSTLLIIIIAMLERDYSFIEYSLMIILSLLMNAASYIVLLFPAVIIESGIIKQMHSKRP